MNKHSVYIVIGVCLLLISAVILGVYYTQDFNESYSFVNNIDFGNFFESVISGFNGNKDLIKLASNYTSSDLVGFMSKDLTL